jgi:signal transduction histidine kinase
MRLLFLVGLLAWSSLAAWWATYFYRSTLEVQRATLRAYSAEQKLDDLEIEQRQLNVDQAREELQGTVFAIAPRPLSQEESRYPNEVLRGRLDGLAIVVSPEERTRLESLLRRKMIMLAGEGSVLVGLLFACLMVLYRMLVGELQLRRQQESFVHSVTHELKSPLTGLRSLLQSFAALDIPMPERAAYADLGLREIERLDRLVANILLSSRLEADAFRPQATEIDVGASLRRIQERQLHVFKERGGDLLLEVTGPLTGRGDEEAVDVIVRNLVDNALKYSAEKPVVHLRGRMDGAQIVIDVQDNGIGLSEVDQARVFRKFYRAAEGEVRHAKGSGLGLFIARGLARAMQGELSVQSAGPGTGSTFTLTLPT